MKTAWERRKFTGGAYIERGKKAANNDDDDDDDGVPEVEVAPLGLHSCC